MRTQSEQWFEQFCENSGIVCERILENTSKTPDYKLTIGGQRIVVEVKEITRNEDEQKSDRLLLERGYGEVLSNTPGDRVRKKITDCAAQLKASAQGQCPSMLVLCQIEFGCGQVTGHVDPYNIRVAMYGLEQVHIAVPREHSAGPYATGMSCGPKRKMTESDNTSISAIAVLSTPASDDIRLHVYHNKYAAMPIDPTLLAKHGIDQYRLEEDVCGRTPQWKKLFVTCHSDDKG